MDWISTKDKMPQLDSRLGMNILGESGIEYVIIPNENIGVNVLDALCRGFIVADLGLTEKITHWKPLIEN